MLYENYLYMSLMEGAPSWESELKAEDILLIFDFDETIAKTYAKIYVRDNDSGEITKKLSNKEFNTYIQQPDEYFSFEEFDDLDLFFKTSVPIPYTLKIIEDGTMNGYEMAVITARSSSKIGEASKAYITHYFPHAKIYSENIRAINAPNTNYTGSNAEKKVQAFNELVLSGNELLYKGVEFFDDDEKNIKMFNKWGAEMQSKFPEFKYYSKLIPPMADDGYSPNWEGTREYQTAEKSKKVTRPKIPVKTKTRTLPKQQVTVWEAIRRINDNRPDLRFIDFELNSKMAKFEDEDGKIVEIKL